MTADRDFRLHRAGLIVLVALVGVFAAKVPTLRELAVLWGETAPYTHGPLLFVVSIWLIWRQRTALSVIKWAPCWWFLLPIAGVAFVGIVPMSNLRMVLLPISAILLVGLIAGLPVARRIAIPLLLLHFSLPGWGFCLPILLEWTTRAVTLALRLVNIPAFIEAQYVTIPSGRFVIEEGCAGVKYFVAGGSLAAIFSYLYIKSIWRSLAMVAAGFALAIVANWVRVFSIIVIGHLTNMQSSLVNDHNFFGWVIFGITLVPLFWFGGWLSRDSDITAAQEQEEVSQPAALPAAQARASTPALVMAALAGVVLLGMTSVLARSVPRPAYQEIILPDRIGDWAKLRLPPDFRPALTGAARRTHVQFDHPESTIDLSIGMYTGGAATELVNAYEHFEHLAGWRVVDQRILLRDNGHNPARVRERELSHSGRRHRLTWHWYHVAGRSTPNRYMARLNTVRTLAGGRKDAAQFVVSTACSAECTAARKRLDLFVRDAMSAFDQAASEAVKNKEPE